MYTYKSYIYVIIVRPDLSCLYVYSYYTHAYSMSRFKRATRRYKTNITIIYVYRVIWCMWVYVECLDRGNGTIVYYLRRCFIYFILPLLLFRVHDWLIKTDQGVYTRYSEVSVHRSAFILTIYIRIYY